MIRFKFVLILFLGIAISLLGLKYRLRQYTDYPTTHDSFDEIGYLWLGKSLSTSGVPANWSALPIYTQYLNKTKVNLKGYNLYSDNKLTTNPSVLSLENTFPDNYKSQFLIVQPYLDNPPLAGLVFNLADQTKSIYNPSFKFIRLVPVFLSSLTVFLVYLFGLRLFNLRTAVITALIYALSPGFVISSRMALPENLLSFLFILALFLYFHYSSGRHPRFLYLTALICFLAVWIKVSGLIIAGSILLISLHDRKTKESLIIATSGLLGFLTYLAYGFLYNSELFLQMLSVQSSRAFAGPASIIYQLLHPRIPVNFFDGWQILGLISFFVLLILFKNHKQIAYLTSSVGVYLLFFTIFGGLNFPWYQFIIFPLLCLSLGITLDYFFRFPRWEFNTLFFLVMVSTLMQYYFYTSSWLGFLNPYRIFLFIFVLVGLIFRNKLVLRASLTAMFVFSLYMGIYIINHLNFLWPLLSLNKINLI